MCQAHTSAKSGNTGTQ